MESAVSDCNYLKICSGRMESEPAPSLNYLSSENVLRIERKLESFAKESSIPSKGIEGVLTDHDAPLVRFRDGYTCVCFDPKILDLGGFAAGRPLLEAGSGNNDLGYFGSLRAFMPPIWGRTNHFLSNYSGGRGDYFALGHLVTIHNQEFKHVTGVEGSYKLENFCMTSGGQGGLAIVASYLKSYFPGSKIVVSNSTYCNNYAPFRHSGVGISFVETGLNTGLPSVEAVTKALAEPTVKAWLYVRFHNPSGEEYTTHELREIVKALKERDQLLVYPEAYESLVHDPKQVNRYLEILRISEDLGFKGLVRVRTISKEFGLSGLRAAYLIVPEDIATHGHNLNAVQMFNPPMLNAPVLVSSTYLRHLTHGGAKIPEIDQYLGSDITNFHDCHPILKDFSMQNEELAKNVRFVASELVGDKNLEGRSSIEDDRTYVILPKGGINMYVRLKDFEGVDQSIFFRRAYLLTGLILQPSSLLGHKAGFWVRITVSHRQDRLAECLKAIKHIRANRYLFDVVADRLIDPMPVVNSGVEYFA